MKSETKKQEPTPTKIQAAKKDEGLMKGNGTKASAKPEDGRNKNGKDGAKAGAEDTY